MYNATFGYTDYEINNGRTMYGRIRDYSYAKGYGFIYTETGKDLFVSSYDLEKIEKKLVVGTTLKFIPAFRKDRYIAADITIVANDTIKEIIYLPNDNILPIKDLQKFDYLSGKSFLRTVNISEQELEHHGYDIKSLDYIYFRTKYDSEYHILQEGSPIKGDGHVPNLRAFYNELCDRFYRV